MPTNIEIKARLATPDQLHSIAAELSNSTGCELHQKDTFFKVASGRLKLRQLEGETTGELIFYDRPDDEGPKLSSYTKTHVVQADDLRRVLDSALGTVGVVVKKRTLYMIGQTRVHVDEVENLGNFVELEVVISDASKVADGEAIANDLMEKLKIKPEDLLRGAYMDMLLKNLGV